MNSTTNITKLTPSNPQIDIDAKIDHNKNQGDYYFKKKDLLFLKTGSKYK